MEKPDIEGIRNQLHMLERAVRAVRANLESLAVSSRTIPKREGVSILDCALSGLLARPVAIDRRITGPYETITEGVRTAYPPRGDIVGISVESRAFPAEEAEQGAGSSCLLLRVRRKGAGTPAWATLEVDLDAVALMALASLQARMILSFQSHGWQPLGTYRVFLRLLFEKEYKDYFSRNLPAIDMPIEAALRIGREDYATLPRIGVQAARLIIVLPMTEDADYTAILSHFEISGG